MVVISEGAEAVILLENDTIIKKRIKKNYRIKEIDEKIRRKRTKNEAKLISLARRHGVNTPIIRDVSDFVIKMEYVKGEKLKDVITIELSEKAGELVGKLHSSGIIHGDLTTSNMILRDGKLVFIDFGLAYLDKTIEARGVDLHVIFQTYLSTHENHEELTKAFIKGYSKTFDDSENVLKRVKEIESRGRYA